MRTHTHTHTLSLSLIHTRTHARTHTHTHTHKLPSPCPKKKSKMHMRENANSPTVTKFITETIFYKIRKLKKKNIYLALLSPSVSFFTIIFTLICTQTHTPSMHARTHTNSTPQSKTHKQKPKSGPCVARNLPSFSLPPAHPLPPSDSPSFHVADDLRRDHVWRPPTHPVQQATAVVTE